MKKLIWIVTTVLLTAGSMCLSGCGSASREPLSETEFMLNTFVTLTLYDSRDQEIMDGCLELCRSYETIFSKTMESSEVYKLNHRRPEESVFQVSEDLAELLERGIYYSQMSEGAFDITVDPLTSLWNFTGPEYTVPEKSRLEEAVKKVGYENLKLEGSRLEFLSPDTTIDVGAIAKGYIADKMKEYLIENGVESAVISLGGNVLCVGNRPDKSPFRIGLQKPFADRTEQIATLEIRDLSVVSSGVYERNFIIDGKNYHHILNPMDGYPYDNGLVSVTIISSQSVDGDGLSTACFSLGLEDGLQLLNSLENTYGIFITEDYQLHYSDGAEEFILKN